MRRPALGGGQVLLLLGEVFFFRQEPRAAELPQVPEIDGGTGIAFRNETLREAVLLQPPFQLRDERSLLLPAVGDGEPADLPMQEQLPIWAEVHWMRWNL